jgi:hypothetical protein
MPGSSSVSADQRYTSTFEAPMRLGSVPFGGVPNSVAVEIDLGWPARCVRSVHDVCIVIADLVACRSAHHPGTASDYCFDDRRLGATPEFAEALETLKASWRRSWGIALFTIPFLAMLVWNLSFFGGVDSYFAAMVPLWTIMFVLLFIISLYAFSMAGTMESGTKNAFRGAMYVLISRPFMSVFLSVFLLFLVLLMSVMVLPMLLIGPALIACIVNRVTLSVLGEPVIDPDAPTPERAEERARGLNPDPGLLSRFRRKPEQKNR